MKKVFKLLLVVIAIALCANNASAVTKKTAGSKAAKTAKTSKMTKEEFFKKWGDQYDKFRTCDVYIGLPQQFFLDMQAALPNHFKMKYDTKDMGVTYYVAVHIFGDVENHNIFMFSLGFDKKGFYFFDYQFANTDKASEANLCRGLNWTRSWDTYEEEEDAFAQAMESSIEF